MKKRKKRGLEYSPERVRTAMYFRMMNCPALAKAISKELGENVSRQVVHRWMWGNSRPSLRRALALANVLCCGSIRSLMEEVER